MTNYNKLNRTIKALTIAGLFLFAFMTGIAYLYSLCMAMLDLAYMAVIVSPYMAIMDCLNWSNLQECRFNRLFDPLTLWILTMQLNWYRCNLVKPITCMAAIVSPFTAYLLALLVRIAYTACLRLFQPY